MRCVKFFTGLIGLAGLAFSLHASQNAFAAEPLPRSAQMPAVIGIASFNMAWAGTAGDFKKHLEICSAPTVNWCDTRPRTLRGADAPTVEEQARADACQAATITAAGGRSASMMMAPCNAYRFSDAPTRGAPPRDTALLRNEAAYAGKLAGLRATVENLIEHQHIRVIAFQEVKSKDTVVSVLGKFANKFDVCMAAHDAFQTLGFAWDKSLSARPGQCATNDALAIKDPVNDPAAFRRVRPGLALELTINGGPVTFMNVHLKAGCANAISTDRYPGRLVNDAHPNCEVLNRQVPILEDWLEAVALKTPRLVWLGDFNRLIDEELALNIANDQVRADGSNPAGVNKKDASGKVATKYLWPEIADGVPVALHQVPLSTKEGGCSGFVGLDHAVISDALKKLNPGTIASRKLAVRVPPGQLMEVSDHCPRILQLKF